MSSIAASENRTKGTQEIKRVREGRAKRKREREREN